MNEQQAITKPPVPYEERVWALAIQDALQLEDMMPRDRANFLTHFFGYPVEGNDKDLEACEREAFIDFDDEVDGVHWDHIVWLRNLENTGMQGHGFVDEDVAYVFFCKHYNDIREMLGIIKTHSTTAEVTWARKYWKNLSDVELYDFYWEYMKPTNHTFPDVDTNTTFSDYLVISARQSDYEKRMDI